MDHSQLRALPCFVLLSAAVVLFAGGILIVHPPTVLAQSQGSGLKPKEQNGEVDSKEAERRAEQVRKAIEEYKQAAEGLSSRAGAPECVWTGRRIASLLWRDDLGTAERYMSLYKQFDCSLEHMKLAFRCVIKQGPLDLKAAEELAARVHNCWVLPKELASEASHSTKSGTESE